MTNHHKLRDLTTRKVRIALGLLTLGASACFTPAMHAADPYDQTLEQRVEALERELNTMSGDDKGKNVSNPTDVPTFMRAAGKEVQQLTISGDLRFRYNYDNEDFQYPGAGNELQRSRYLVRLRLNLNYTLSDNFFLALGVATNGQSDSQNQPITEGFDDFGIYLHQFLIGYKATSWATFILGKQFGPFYDNEDAIVDFGDITPTGLTEKLTFEISPKLSVAVNLGQYIFYDNPESGYTVTPTTVASSTVATTNAATRVTTTTVNNETVNVYSQNPASTIPQERKEDAILTYNDVVITYKPTDKITLTLAPGFYDYLLHGSVGLSGNAVGQSGRSDPNDVNTNPAVATTVVTTKNGANTTTTTTRTLTNGTQGGLLNNAAFNSDLATRDLAIALFDGDVKFPIGPFKGKLYWDFAYNIEGSERAHQVYNVQTPGGFRDSNTWLAGIQIGELKRKGDFYVSADYRQYGLASIDPNLNDPNFALSRLNTQGFRVNLGYNITDWLKAEVWYYGAWNLDKNVRLLSTGAASANNAFYDANAVQNLIVQLTSSF